MEKVKVYSGVTIHLGDYTVIRCDEQNDGVWNVEFGGKEVRVAIPEEHGTAFRFFKNIITAVHVYERTSAPDVLEGPK